MSSIRTIQELAHKLESSTCGDVVHHYLDVIKKNEHLNAYAEVFEQSAIERSRLLDGKPVSERGSLYGVVIGIKDNICYKDHSSQASSGILSNFISPYSATAVERILAEDAIIIGRLNCDEFGMGSTNENSCYGPVLNPLDNSRSPGGSSGGCAAAVSAGLCTVALASSTGGSIRQPASHCGIVGLKPSYGRVSRYGLMAYGSSLDQIGVLANNVDDAERTLKVISGHCQHDATSVTTEWKSSDRPVKRIAYFSDFLDHNALDDDIKAQFNSVVGELEKDYEVEALSFPLLEQLIPCYYVLSTAEASSNLNRYDGIRYGHRSQEAKSLEEVYRYTRTEGFGSEVKRRIMLGSFVLSAGYSDAYYTKAQQIRRLLVEFMTETFQSYDMILSPVAPSTAPLLGDSQDVVAMYLSDIYTVLANLTGIPAISIPIGECSADMPFGLQIAANRFRESELLNFSKELFSKFAPPNSIN